MDDVYIGSGFEALSAGKGIHDDVDAVAMKRVAAWKAEASSGEGDDSHGSNAHGPMAHGFTRNEAFLLRAMYSLGDGTNCDLGAVQRELVSGGMDEAQAKEAMAEGVISGLLVLNEVETADILQFPGAT